MARIGYPMLQLFFGTYITLFFLLTPFFVISTFLSMTAKMSGDQRKRVALRTVLAIIVCALSIYLLGSQVFKVLGITLDAFRVGAGAMLFLSAMTLVAGRIDRGAADDNEDIAVVPLAMPVTVGPGTTGALLVLGTDVAREFGNDVASHAVALSALLSAVLSVGAMLYFAATAQRHIHPRIMSVLTKLTGLILASLSAQLILTGIRNFMVAAQ